MCLYLSCFRIVDFLLLWYCLIELLLSVSGRGEGIVICQIFVNYCYLFLFSLKITKAKFKKKKKKNWKKLFFFNSNSNSILAGQCLLNWHMTMTIHKHLNGRWHCCLSPVTSEWSHINIPVLGLKGSSHVQRCLSKWLMTMSTVRHPDGRRDRYLGVWGSIFPQCIHKAEVVY